MSKYSTGNIIISGGLYINFKETYSNKSEPKRLRRITMNDAQINEYNLGGYWQKMGFTGQCVVGGHRITKA